MTLFRRIISFFCHLFFGHDCDKEENAETVPIKADKMDNTGDEGLFSSISESLSETLSEMVSQQHLQTDFNEFVENVTNILIDPWAQLLLSFITGIFFIIFAQLFFVWKMCKTSKALPPIKLKQKVLQLPKGLKDLLGTEHLKKKEEGVWINFLLQYFFWEYKDDLRIRKFIIKKLQEQLGEIHKQKAAVLIDDLFLRDFSFGGNCPVISSICVDTSEVKDDIVKKLDLRFTVKYDGGFQIAVDALLPFNRTAFISMTVKKFKGNIRLQFLQAPYSCWSFCCYEDPLLELDVVAQLDGRPLPKIRNIFVGLIKKMIRRSYTLPYFGLRFSPFFERQKQPRLRQRRITVDGIEIGKGLLKLTIISATRLPIIVKGSKLYVSITLDPVPFRQLIADERKSLETLYVSVKKRDHIGNLGLTLEDRFLTDRLQPAVVVGKIGAGPGLDAGFKKDDIVISLSGNLVVSAEQTTKLIASSKDKFRFQVERKKTTNEPKDPKDRKASRTPVKSQSDTILSNLFVRIGEAARNLKPATAKKTKKVEASEDPKWDETVVYNTHAGQPMYLNIRLWCSGGDPKEKVRHFKIEGHPNADLLMGYTTLEMDDIFLTCLLCLSGCLTQRVKLKHGHYRTDPEIIKEWAKNVTNFDPTMMYGDLLLGFHFMTNELTPTQRQTMSGSQGYTVLNVDGPAKGVNFSGGGAAVIRKDSMKTAGHHQFDVTTFTSATSCDYCGRKIWMKEAFLCNSCSMVCHKKCLVHCLLNTHCTIFGVRGRYNLDEPWQPTKNRKGKHKKTQFRERQPSIADQVIALPKFERRKSIKVMTQLKNTVHDVDESTRTVLHDLFSPRKSIFTGPKSHIDVRRKSHTAKDVNPMRRVTSFTPENKESKPIPVTSTPTVYKI